MSEQDQIKAQELFSQGYNTPKKFVLCGKEEYVLSNGITVVIVNKEIYEFIEGLLD